MPSPPGRIPILYLAPWVDIGGSDKGTVDWFRWLDPDRFEASLITTQPSPNRRLNEITPYAEEIWDLPQLMAGEEFPRFITDFIYTRGIKLVHIMNSRLGFELLPDMASLPVAPRIVVQLHLEEPDRSGYVRYVTTRYGNLVDAFSVSSQDLSDRLATYEVPGSKCRLIRTGVDAAHEFCPERVNQVEASEHDRFTILFPGRLTAQKDPLLMVEVAARLRALGFQFRIDVVGDGELTDAVRRRIHDKGLSEEITLHGPRTDMPTWYARSDAVLLTSAFEGLPYVAYEAMAMALPLVAADVGAVRELVTPGTGILIEARADAESYATALAELIADRALSRRLGDGARARVAADFSVERMAAEYGELYDELVDESPAPAISGEHPRSGPNGQRPDHVAFLGRIPGSSPLVSVIVPCFNHGRYLRDCLRSVIDQSYRPLEVTVIDDGSTDPETLEVLLEIERDDVATVSRMPCNSGPSATRNAGIAEARGRYILPLDADNLLLPGALAKLVEQLSSAGERTGFIYPSMQYFGNRTDVFEPPSYNLAALLDENFVDSSCFFDREVFERGFRYPEDIRLGHEDWDLAVSLAAHGIYGEPAHAATLLFRKFGFTRSELVEAAAVPFRERLADRHPELFDLSTRAGIKWEWNPALSIIALDPILGIDRNATEELASTAKRQTCGDFELIVVTDEEFGPTSLGHRYRRVPDALAATRAHALAEALAACRGRYVMATYGSPTSLLADRALIEKLLRIFAVNDGLAGLVLADGGDGPTPFALLDPETARRAVPSAVCWKALGPQAPPASLLLDSLQPLETIARSLPSRGTMQWRQLPRQDRGGPTSDRGGSEARLGSPRFRRSSDAALRQAPAALPGCPLELAPRRVRGSWEPPHTKVLCRHVAPDTGRHLHTNSRRSPPGYRLQHVLGCVRKYPFLGTKSVTLRDETFVFGENAPVDAPALLGFVEQAPLPMLDPLLIGRDRRTRQLVLAVERDDELAQIIDDVHTVGYLEPVPIQPGPPPRVRAPGIIGLVRTVDLASRRHQYAAGRVPPGVPAGELGSLLEAESDDVDPLWVTDEGHVYVESFRSAIGRPSPSTIARWTLDPLTWRGLGPMGPRMRASARRALEGIKCVTFGPSVRARPGEPAGYVLRSATAYTVPLYAARHPVTGDVLLSTVQSEAVDLGYEGLTLLGHLIADAPVTGSLGPMRSAVPWASYFGTYQQN